MLELATKPFYDHGGVIPGLILVGVVCGSMLIFYLWMAWRTFGPPSKRQKRTG